ncbi:TIGR01841 family phasin [Microvirga aerophila]|uniref:Phasin domain-containing protein n=1 Tax=Microvirga aerophila TaxID=670291 RepID=A0A512BZ08_9HYPH|nr:TIGR01841 family phasin [Microvirga aerophila]GEO17189.1 hypothetical protein MAE02_48850 [Microvirga aerophila]
MTTRTFSQTTPDKANELFDKLLATSDNAAKTRERLLSDLQEELDLLANLQEQYLFPVLNKHGMQDLVQEAIQDNQETSALLAELDSMPKNTGEFLSKVTELKKVFQQHIRDDKKELLPAVLKVLSDEEAEEVAEQVQDEMASVEEAKRAEAKRAREQVENAQRVAKDVTNTVQAGAQTMARTMQEAVQTSLSTASELARGVQDVSRECFELSQKRLQKNLDGLNSLAQCRSVPDFMAVQTSLIRDNLEQTLDNSRRMVDLTRQLANEASRIVTVQAEKSRQRVSRAA